MIIQLILLLCLLWDSGLCLDPCTTDPKLQRSFVHKERGQMGIMENRLRDSRCMAKVVPGAWCAWEPLETGHGVTSCQKGLNIRWRRRICSCPPPQPIHDPKTWCQLDRNSAAEVAQLKYKNYSRLEALKHEVWISDKLWELKTPFKRLSSVTNSLLGCLHFDECYFHTGGSYTGKLRQAVKSPCQKWEDFKKFMESDGMKPSSVKDFLETDPQNYCRNPYAQMRIYTAAKPKPWCFTGKYTSGHAEYPLWEYCNIRACSASQFLGSYIFPDTPPDEVNNKMMYSGKTNAPDRSIDVNAESCFATCRFRCEKYAVLNVRGFLGGSNLARCCFCYSENQIKDPDKFFKGREIDSFALQPESLKSDYNLKFGFDGHNGVFKNAGWDECYLYSSPFRCPLVENEHDQRNLFGSVFELALPRSCHETNHLVSEDFTDTMTVFGSMGNFLLSDFTHSVFQHSNNHVRMSSKLFPGHNLTTLCSHRSIHAPSCPKLDTSSIHDSNSYFNHVVDAGYHWIIFDVGDHVPLAIVNLEGDSKDLLPLEVFVRSSPLPTWLTESDFTFDGKNGKTTKYFQRATLAEQMLWWRCEDVKMSGSKKNLIYSECSPHQRTRWIMLRLKVHSDMLDMKYNLGYGWISPNESCCIRVKKLVVLMMRPERLNCLVMHHPPMGPEYSDYWEDLYSFDADGQPLDPPIITPVHPQFKLPLLTHDSINPEEQFVQEDWDVEACGDWEIQENTTIVGVPAKLKITFTASDRRGENCNTRRDEINPDPGTQCRRAVYFRVDATAEELVHYPDFGRSYDLAYNLKNCQFICAIARECKAFEFSMGQFCRLHLISYRLDTMFVYSQNTIYGRKSDIMRTTNPFTWNNPFHPYYRLLQDLLTESRFSR